MPDDKIKLERSKKARALLSKKNDLLLNAMVNQAKYIRYLSDNHDIRLVFNSVMGSMRDSLSVILKAKRLVNYKVALKDCITDIDTECQAVIDRLERGETLVDSDR